MKFNFRIDKSQTAGCTTQLRCSPKIRTPLKFALGTMLYVGAFLVQSVATPIVYTFSGIGTGMAGASSFANAAFSLSVYSDTTDVAIVGFTGGRNIYSADASLATITIAGIGSGTFTEGTRVFNTQGIQILGFSLSTALGGYDLWDFNCPDAENYDLTGPFGPVNASPARFSANLTSQPTTLGNLTFNSAPNIAFSAALVPEPSALCICGAALVAISFSRRYIRSRDR